MDVIREARSGYGQKRKTSKPAAAATPAAGRKVSARLEATAAQHLAALTHAWKANITEVLRRALAEAAERERPKKSKKPNAYELLLASGFIGSGGTDAPPDLSSNYKHHISESLAAKHGFDPDR